MKKIGGNKGITLIALIITIIVMLILVGVTVAVAINGGLFETAKKAARKTERAKMDEEIQTIIAAMNADILAHPENHKITEDEFPVDDETITEELAFAFYFKKPVKNIEENFKIKENIIKTYSYETEEFRSADIFELIKEQCLDENTFFENGIVKFPCTYKENIELNIIVEMKFGDTSIEVVSYSLELSDGMTIKQTADEVELTAGGNIKEIKEGAPIPKGFYYVAGTKDTGVVISDNQADENNESGNNGNQFVWVPVKVNPKLEIKVDSGKDIKTIRILNSDGYDETINVNSDVFEKTIDIQKNSIYEIIVTYKDGSVDDKIYEVDSVYQKSTRTMKLVKIVAILGNMSEEEIIDSLVQEAAKDPNSGINTRMDYIKMTETGYKEQYNDSAIETESVLKYGGFYIGRYEVGTDGTIKKGIYPKNNISYEDAKTKSETMYNDNSIYGVKSGMISGIAWDATCKWLLDSGSKSYTEVYCENGWGNFKTSSGIGSHGTLRTTGFSEANNIYDLAGNLEELTTETKTDSTITYNIARGGSYEDSKNLRGSSVFTIESNKSEPDAETGYRPILYFY